MSSDTRSGALRDLLERSAQLSALADVLEPTFFAASEVAARPGEQSFAAWLPRLLGKPIRQRRLDEARARRRP